MSESGAIKLFVSHASEDKALFVQPLVDALKDNGFELWYDKDDLHSTQSLLQGIGDGLKWCDFGIVVFSKVYFAKKWTMGEVDGLYALETETRKIIIQIWLDVTVEDVTKVFPMLAGRKAINGRQKIPEIVKEIRQDVEFTQRVRSLTPLEEMKAALRGVVREQAAVQYHQNLIGREEGVKIIVGAVEATFNNIAKAVEEFAGVQPGWEVKQNGRTNFVSVRIVVGCPYDLTAYVYLRRMAMNYAGEARLVVELYKDYYDGGYEKKYVKKMTHEFSPFIVSETIVEWSGGNQRLDNASFPHWLMGRLCSYVHDEAPKR